MVPNRLDDDVARFGSHEPNAFLIEKLPNLVSGMIVLIFKVRRTDRQTRLDTLQEGFICEPIIGAMMRQDPRLLHLRERGERRKRAASPPVRLSLTRKAKAARTDRRQTLRGFSGETETGATRAPSDHRNRIPFPLHVAGQRCRLRRTRRLRRSMARNRKPGTRLAARGTATPAAIAVLGIPMKSRRAICWLHNRSVRWCVFLLGFPACRQNGTSASGKRASQRVSE